MIEKTVMETNNKRKEIKTCQRRVQLKGIPKMHVLGIYAKLPS
jgi:hypothetical protein